MAGGDQAEIILKELVDAIDRKWSLETEKRRSNAISPAMDEALARARHFLGIAITTNVDDYRKRFR